MEKKFKNKYRILSNRLRGWDYSSNGHYFITIVTAYRENLFGEITNGEMILNDIGKIIENEFFKSFEIRKELYLGRFVIMPNHLHAIIILDNTNDGSYNIETYGKIGETHGRDVETHGRASLPQFIRRPKSISSFVAGFKSSSVNRINEWMDLKGLYSGKFNRTNPLWQANYHDHIIRNKKEYQNIELYIENNPTNWEKDSLK
jgi:REP element-mobilizing transposase RayT